MINITTTDSGQWGHGYFVMGRWLGGRRREGGGVEGLEGSQGVLRGP